MEIVCEAFGIDPERARQQDKRLVQRVLFARAARRASAAMNETGKKMTKPEAKIYDTLLDALDRRDESRGLPEED